MPQLTKFDTEYIRVNDIPAHVRLKLFMGVSSGKVTFCLTAYWLPSDTTPESEWVVLRQAKTTMSIAKLVQDFSLGGKNLKKDLTLIIGGKE